jgi:hypothetical protein
MMFHDLVAKPRSMFVSMHCCLFPCPSPSPSSPQIFELEEEVARLREVASASGADKDRLRALQNLLDVAKRSADAANAESKELRARLKKLEAAKTQEGDEFDVRAFHPDRGQLLGSGPIV